jgi:hypothetical protein
VSEAALQIMVWPCHNRSPWILASGAKYCTTFGRIVGL